jgi:hypothetical protein
MTDLDNRPTPERTARAMQDGESLISQPELIAGDVGYRPYRLNDAPLGRLFFCKNPKIDREQYNAGERFYGVCYYAGAVPHMVPDMSRDIVDGGGGDDMTDHIVAAKTRHHNIVKRMPYQWFHICDAMIVQEMPLSEYAERYRASQRRIRQAIATDRIICALDWLVDYFDLKPKPRHRSFIGEKPGIIGLPDAS